MLLNLRSRRRPAASAHDLRGPAALLLVAALGGGCVAPGGDLGTVAPPAASGGSSLDVPSPEPTPGSPTGGSPGPSGATPGPTTTVRAYFMLGSHTGNGGLVPVLREVPKTSAVGAAAMTQLLAGPAGAELTSDPAMFSDVPDATRFLGLTIDAGTASVNLSSEFAAGGTSATIAQRYGQVVYTLTQFPTIQRVAFLLDGQPAAAVVATGSTSGPITRPVTRSDFDGLLPAIFVDRPAWGGALANPGRITGVADVFEAHFRLRLLDAAGSIVADVPVQATCGSGCWGTFDVTVPYSVGAGQWGTLRVFEPSAKDGSPTSVVDYPVWLTP